MYDGFVNKMEKIEGNHHMHKEKFGDQACTLEAPLHIQNISIVYDVLFKFKDYEGGSTFIITFEEMEFLLKVRNTIQIF